MKTLTQTIIPIVALSLLAAGVVSANNASDEEIHATKTDIGAMLAQAQPSQPATPAPPTVPAPTPAAPKPATTPTPPTLPGISKNIYNLTNAISYGSRTGGSDMVLVIPTEQTKTEDLIAINEDMNVMARILEKNLEQDRIATSGSSIFMSSSRDPFGILFGGSRGDIQSMYLQGYGALFMLKVDFPLSPTPDVQQEKEETNKEERGDPVWKQTRQEMFEPENINRRRSEKPEEKYDPEKIENLKTTLIKTLKHATNIRTLKPDESVILSVTGSGEYASDVMMLKSRRTVMVNGHKRIIDDPLIGSTGFPSCTVIVIRVKKSEIDAFAKGELDFDKFRASVQVFSYPYLGSVELRGDSSGLYMGDEPRSTGSSSTP
jgi:hypothetical protein